ncbi:MAG: hypothetical protein U7127_19065 [Phormidium sp.]
MGTRNKALNQKNNKSFNGKHNYRHSPRTVFYLVSLGGVVVMGILTSCGVSSVVAGAAAIALGGLPVIIDVHTGKAKETEDAEIKEQLTEIREQLKALEAAQKQLIQENK